MKFNLLSIVYSLLSIVYCLVTSGCAALIENEQQIQTLRDISAGQVEINKYVKEQEELFAKLLKRVKKGPLPKGISKQEIITAYGNPVIARKVEGDPVIYQELLYRKPTEYINTYRIYLYFDADAKLVHQNYESSKN